MTIRRRPAGEFAVLAAAGTSTYALRRCEDRCDAENRRRSPGGTAFHPLDACRQVPAQKRLAFAVVVGILVVFALITFGPLKGVHLGRVDAFVPAYATAMFVCDSITAILLYAQFSILRSRAILVIASGYLFAALILIPWILVFPGVFAPGKGLMGGMQTTSWVYFFQHAGFPLFVIGYALLKDEDPDRRISARHSAHGDRPEHHFDRGPRLGSGISFHSGRSVLAARDSRFDSSQSAVALCWGPGRVAKYRRHRRSLDPATRRARSLADGRDVSLCDRDTSELLP